MSVCVRVREREKGTHRERDRNEILHSFLDLNHENDNNMLSNLTFDEMSCIFP